MFKFIRWVHSHPPFRLRRVGTDSVLSHCALAGGFQPRALFPTSFSSSHLPSGMLGSACSLTVLRHFLLECKPAWRSNSVGEMQRCTAQFSYSTQHALQEQAMALRSGKYVPRTPLHTTATHAREAAAGLGRPIMWRPLEAIGFKLLCGRRLAWPGYARLRTA